MFFRLRQKRRDLENARRLYEAIVVQARTTSFYVEGGVPDTLDGRFEMIVLHTYLVVKRLMRDGENTSRLGQYVFDTMVIDMDRSLREMGVGDLSVGRKMKAMGEAYYGRSRAYDQCIEADDESLAIALERNVFGSLAQNSGLHITMAADLAEYCKDTLKGLDNQNTKELEQGMVKFLSFPRD